MCISYIARPAGRTASEDRINCQWAIIAIAGRVASSTRRESRRRRDILIVFIFIFTLEDVPLLGRNAEEEEGDGDDDSSQAPSSG